MIGVGGWTYQPQANPLCQTVDALHVKCRQGVRLPGLWIIYQAKMSTGMRLRDARMTSVSGLAFHVLDPNWAGRPSARALQPDMTPE